MLCCFKKISTIICGCVEKRRRKNKSGQSEPKNDLLQREEELYRILIRIQHYILDKTRSTMHTYIPMFVSQN